jgi:hypothetical protein
MTVLSKTLNRAQNFNIDERTKRLEAIIAWRDELRQRLADALNDAWGPPPDLDELKAEVELFKMCCKGARI